MRLLAPFCKGVRVIGLPNTATSADTSHCMSCVPSIFPDLGIRDAMAVIGPVNTVPDICCESFSATRGLGSWGDLTASSSSHDARRTDCSSGHGVVAEPNTPQSRGNRT